MAMGADYYAEKESAKPSAAVCASFVATARSTSAWETVRGTTTLAPRGGRFQHREGGYRRKRLARCCGERPRRLVFGKYTKLT